MGGVVGNVGFGGRECGVGFVFAVIFVGVGVKDGGMDG